MSNKKESTVQLIAGVLGIVASALALQDWYGNRRAAGSEHASASASMIRLHKPGKRIVKPIAEPETQTAEAPASSAPRGVPAGTVSSLVQGGATTAPPVQASPTSPAASSAAAAVSATPRAPSPSPSPPPAAPAAAADPFRALVNGPAGARAGVAVAVRGEGAARLRSGLEQRGVNVLPGFFRDGFVESAYFSQLLAGDGGALRGSGVLAAGARVLVGELRASYQDAAGVVTCNLAFRYVVLDASRIGRRQVGVTVVGDDRAAALDEAIAMLLEEHGATVAADAGG